MGSVVPVEALGCNRTQDRVLVKLISDTLLLDISRILFGEHARNSSLFLDVDNPVGKD